MSLSSDPQQHSLGGWPVRERSVTILGAGQLARMMHQESISLGITTTVLATSSADPASIHNAHVGYGSENSLQDIMRAAADSSVVTFEHEHVAPETLHQLDKAGLNVQPPTSALRIAQDKALMRAAMDSLSLPNPKYCVPHNAQQAVDFFDRCQGLCVLKTARGGYDGRGVWIFGSNTDSDIAQDREKLSRLVSEILSHGDAVVVEEKILFHCELAASLARSVTGQIKHYELTQTWQVHGQCHTALVPYIPDDPSWDFRAIHAQARHLAETVAVALNVTGMLTVELFLTQQGNLLVNELAMRPHNSMHWTLGGSYTSQFQQHLRAILGLPLGDTECVGAGAVMVNFLGADDPQEELQDRVAAVLARHPRGQLHLYEKQEKPARKLGHIMFIVPEGAEDLRRSQLEWKEQALAAGHYLSTGRDGVSENL